MQIFDEYRANTITAQQAMADGPRYGIVWGPRPGMPRNWHANNPSLVATYYMPQETDASSVSWGRIGHDLAWWEKTHPDWILYACTPSGTPTKSAAYIAQLPNNVPLDVHNPDVIAYQIRTTAAYSIANDYNGLAVDEVVFYNATGSALGTGYYGCGIYSRGKFVRRYNGEEDPAWTADTVAWVKRAHDLLTTDRVIAPHHIKLVINHPAGNVADPNEQAILENTDSDLNEVGFSDYGNYHASYSLFKTTTDWMRFVQAHGVKALIGDNFSQTTPLTRIQVEYALATYLMGDEGNAELFAGNSNSYGAEQYLPQYQTDAGAPCGDYYADPKYPAIWYRKYSNAFIIVNSGSSSTQIAHMPPNRKYIDIMWRRARNPMVVASGDAFVLLTDGGCD